MTPLDLHPIRFRQLGAWKIVVELASGDEAFSPEPGPEAAIAARQQRPRSHRPAEGPQRVGRGFCPRRETERLARPFHPPCAGVPGLPPSSRHLGERGLLAGGTGLAIPGRQRPWPGPLERRSTMSEMIKQVPMTISRVRGGWMLWLLRARAGAGRGGGGGG